MSARDPKEVELPQLVGTLPDRLLLCSASVAKLAKQSVAPQVEGKVPFTLLFCTYSSVSDCTTQAQRAQPLQRVFLTSLT